MPAKSHVSKKKTVRNSIQNKELTQEDALEYLARMAEFDEAISQREEQVKNLKKALRIDEKKKGIQSGMRSHLKEIYSANKKARKAKFDVFVDLIVRLRNQYTIDGRYTKRHFRKEVRTYL